MSGIESRDHNSRGDWRRFAEDPLEMTKSNVTELFSLSDKQRDAIHLEGARRRFGELRGSVAALARLADEQKINEIETLEDIAPLLFSHTVYKSYPLSFIENGNFTGLTKWLNGVTSVELSSLDASACGSIDEWLALLETHTPIQCSVTSGTSGKMSLLPRSADEWPIMAKGFFLWRQQGFGHEPRAKLSEEEVSRLPVLYLNYRHGRHTTQRAIDALVRTTYQGDENRVRALFPGRMSTDVLSLAGRIRAAEAKGTLSSVKISAAILAQRESFMADQRNMQNAVREFFTNVVEEYRGQRVMVFGTFGQVYDGAVAAREMGLRQVFRADSLTACGGGLKGRSFPADCHQTVVDFLGVPKLQEGYGCTEQMVVFPACCHNHHHCLPMVIPFLLDPQTGAQLPRSGTHTGRYAFLDLMAHTYWGGFVTGDEVTITWDDPCPCGRSGPYVHHEIQRYGEKQGGDDKINCAGMPEAHRSALNFIAQAAGN